MTSVVQPYGDSLGHRIKRTVMHHLHRRLSADAYARVYGYIFSTVRISRRIAYSRFWLYAFLTRNLAAKRRTEIILRTMPHSLVGWRGLELTYEAVVQTECLGEASLVECGVAQGGSAAVMGLVAAHLSRPRPLWLFDSFEGLPDPTPEDFVDGGTGNHLRPLPRGSCLGTIDQVSNLLFAQLKLRHDDVKLVKGWFQDTLPASRELIGPVAVLRIDGDWYSSVKVCLETMYDSVVPGGYIIIDDYDSCFGAQKAVDEFLANRSIGVTLVPDGRGGRHFIRP